MSFSKVEVAEKEKKANDQVEKGIEDRREGCLFSCFSLRTFWVGWGLHRRAFWGNHASDWEGGTFCPGWVLRA